MWSNLSSKTQGVIWIILAKSFFMLMMILVKYLNHFPSLELNFFRSTLILIAITPLVFRNRNWKTMLSSHTPYLHVFRVIFSVISMILLFYGYRSLPLAKASALNYAYALILPLFSLLFLKEHVGIMRWLALGIGYMAVLLILNPLYEGLQATEMVLLLGVILLVSSNTLSKKLTSKDSIWGLVFYSSLGTVLSLGLFYGAQAFSLIAVASPFQWVMPRTKDIYGLIALGLVAFIGQFSYLKAYQKGRLNFYASFDYLKVVWGVAMGIVLFHETPTWQIIIGGLVILGVNLTITLQELRYKE